MPKETKKQHLYKVFGIRGVRRKFGGKKFHIYGSSKTKGGAQIVKKELQEKGFKARVTRCKHKSGTFHDKYKWNVWKRRARKGK